MIGMFSGYFVLLVPGVELVSFAEQVLLEEVIEGCLK